MVRSIATRARLAAGAIVAIAVVALGIGFGWSALGLGGVGVNPDIRCDGGKGRQVSTHILNDSTTKSNESPVELADRWADAMSVHDRYPDAERVFVDQSEDRATIAYIPNREATHAIALLSYENHPSLGWRLDTIRECAN